MITLRAVPYEIPTDQDGETIEVNTSCSVTLGCCSIKNALTKITEKYKVRGSRQRTLENNLRQDITGKYREWSLEFKWFDNGSFNEVYELYKKQCDDFHCVQMKIDNRCDHSGDSCCDDTGGWVKVFITMGDKVYTEDTFQARGFKIKLEESGGERCSTC